MKIDKMTVKTVVNEVFENIKVGEEFDGLGFKKMCVDVAPEMKDKYVETFLRLLRYEHRDEFICICRSKSKFKRVA